MLASVVTPPARAAESRPSERKQRAAFYPPALVERARANAERHAWAAQARDRIVAAAQPWMKMSDEQLWHLMFGNTIRRSWMVWSNGHCPACRKDVPMYNWEMDALARPWKTRCPHCKELFPKNDFERFYRSGLDEHNIFDPKRADRSLLFNAEHPDPADPLHRFGVDDGEGYIDGAHRWRFIGAYLIYGQWKQAVVAGIRNLAAAYTVTGDAAYAHKAGVLLDRVADLYPTFDFGKEGVMYEGPPAAGYVSTWHDACEETREMALAYDQVFEAVRRDAGLAAFLGRMAAKYKPPNPKTSADDVCFNIEERILRDAIRNRDRIRSNYPRTEICLMVIETVLGRPATRAQIVEALCPTLERATAADGVTGEKGLAGYTAFTISGLAVLLEQYARLDPGFLPEVLRRQPRVRDMYRFHIDTMCLGRYYPQSGDTGSFAVPVDRYVAMSLSKGADDLDASMYSFLWHLYEATGDPAFVQVLYRENGGTTDGLPHDLFAADPAAFRKAVADVIAREGAAVRLGSVNKQQWHLAILRSGDGARARAAWLDYDTGGSHSHRDGMNLGLFALGLDLMPDFGYPPVQYGGWGSPRSTWYMTTAAHNTVVVDGRNQHDGAGRTTLWADGRYVRAIRASAPALIQGRQFERIVAMVDVSEDDFYLVDVFRVVGGTDHAKFMHSHFGTITTCGLSAEPCEAFASLPMRGFRCDPNPRPGWSVEWRIDDRLRLLPSKADIRLRYTDFTSGAQAATCEGWISQRGFSGREEAWIPRVMVRRKAEAAPLASTFVAVIEPYDATPHLGAIERIGVTTTGGAAHPDSTVALRISRAGGGCDVFLAADVENPLGLEPSRGRDPVLAVASPSIRTDAELAVIRFNSAGGTTRLAAARGRFVETADVRVGLKEGSEYAEIELESGTPRIVAGAEGVEGIRFTPACSRPR